MAHFAELDKNNYVVRVVVVSNADCLNDLQIEDELIGQKFCENLFGGRWVQTSYNANFRSKFAAIGDWFDADNDRFVNAWWLNKLTGKPFTPKEWHYINAYKQFTTSYRFWAAVPAESDNNSLIDYCNNTDEFKYVPFDYLTHGTYQLKTGVGDIIKLNDENQMTIKIWFQHDKILDAGPIGVIVREVTNFFDYDVAQFAREIHPQMAASTIYELFRLLLEWDFVHTEFGNNEIAAIRSHEFLAAIELPAEIKEELLNLVPDQAVARFIKNESPFVYEIFHGTLPLFDEWIKPLLIEDHEPSFRN